MPYISKAEIQAQQERAKWTGLCELVEIVQAESECSVEVAREQIRNALADGAICPLRWEPEPPESAYCYRSRTGRVRIPTMSELMGLGEPGCPPPNKGGTGWVDYRSVSHWQAVKIDWEQGRVLDEFERNALPQLRKVYRSTDLGPDRPPRPRKAEWRTLWLDREACARHWPPVSHVINPISEAAVIVPPVQCFQAERLGDEEAVVSGGVMPKYHLVSDLLNDLMIESGDIEQWGNLLIIINDEWNNGKIKILRRYSDWGTPLASPEVWEPLQREIRLDQPTSAERWIRCIICSRNERGLIITEFKDPVLTDENARYVMNRAAAAGIVPVEQTNNAETQPGQSDSAALSTHSEAPSQAIAPESRSGIRTIAAVGAERKCQEWLVALTGRPINKDSAFEVARTEIGDRLSRKAFDRAWANVAPTEWKEPGRRKNNSSSFGVIRYLIPAPRNQIPFAIS